MTHTGRLVGRHSDGHDDAQRSAIAASATLDGVVLPKDRKQQ
jgi:hypothetical protein